MRALVLWANDRSANLGVRALAAGAAALVHMIDPKAEVYFHHHGHTDAPANLNRRRALLREWATGRHGFKTWLASFDVIIDTRSGDSFADIYGLRRHVLMTGIAELGHRAGVPLVMAPQTIGPFNTRRGRVLARRTLKTADLVMARDSESARVAEGLGRTADILTTDLVFALPMPEPTVESDVVMNISGLLWQPSPHVDAEAYQRVVLNVYRGLRSQGREVSLLAHVLDSPNSDNDVPAIREFAAAYARDCQVIVPDSLQEARSVVRGANLVIGSRMHACLNALSVGTPAIAIAYSRKFGPLLSELDWPHSVDLRTAPRAEDAVLDIAVGEDLRPQALHTQLVGQQRLRAAADVLQGALHGVLP